MDRKQLNQISMALLPGVFNSPQVQRLIRLQWRARLKYAKENAKTLTRGELEFLSQAISSWTTCAIGERHLKLKRLGIEIGPMRQPWGDNNFGPLGTKIMNQITKAEKARTDNMRVYFFNEALETLEAIDAEIKQRQEAQKNG